MQDCRGTHVMYRLSHVYERFRAELLQHQTTPDCDREVSTCQEEE